MEGGPGGGVDLWHSVCSAPLRLRMHVFEYAEHCGRAWEAQNPGRAKLFYGDQSKAADLANAVSRLRCPGRV